MATKRLKDLLESRKASPRETGQEVTKIFIFLCPIKVTILIIFSNEIGGVNRNGFALQEDIDLNKSTFTSIFQ